MFRETKIKECLRNLSEKIELSQESNVGITASQIADILSLDRANVSKELNGLVRKKEAVKILGRPVLFFDANILRIKTGCEITVYEVEKISDLFKLSDIQEDPFSDVIGYDSSLAPIIKKAKAAMIYPPFGLHTLLIGHTGVGKTMFAEIMHDFAQRQGVLQEGAPFVVFNCAEYAENPQLLLGQLFGYSKGAFTGADQDYQGLVTKARNGILFLDEIHRLPPEGQEMLFVLMDKGEYRKMGSNSNQKADVLILGATTENLQSNLLKTFLRRIPMVIEIPQLSERTMKERFELIERFFANEYAQLKLPIYVTIKVIKALLGYDCYGNIGQLKADIRLLCAKAYLEYKAKSLSRVEVNSQLLNDDMYSGIVETERNPQYLLIESIIRSNIIIYDTEVKKSIQVYDEVNSVVDVYELINNKFDEMEDSETTTKEAKELLRQQLDIYMSQLVTKVESKRFPNLEELFKVVSPRIYRAIEVTLHIAEQRLGRKIPQKSYAAMALHIASILENNIQRNEISAAQIDLAMDNPEEYAVARSIKLLLENELEIELPDQEVIFITLFLSMKEEKKEHARIAMLVLAHGNGVARHMVDVANTLLSTNHAHALDMPLKQSVKDFLGIVIEKVKEINQGKGVLLMVDMGSLLTFGELITEKTGIPIETISMTSMPLVLDATRKTMLADATLESISNDFARVNPYIARYSSQEIKNKIQYKYVIICTCLTGEGAAVKLGKLLDSTVPSIKENNIDIIACNMDSFKEKNIKDKKILCVVGAIDLMLENIPYIATDRIFFGNGIEDIGKIINEAIGIHEDVNSVNPYIARSILKESLTFLDVTKAEDVLQKSFKIIEKEVMIVDYNRILINYLLHVSSMIERCIQNQSIGYVNLEKRLNKDKNLYQVIKSVALLMEEEFKCKIPDTEIAYIMDIFSG